MHPATLPVRHRPPRTVSLAVVLLLLTVIIDFTAAGWMVHLVQADIRDLAARGSYAVTGMTAEEHLASDIREYRVMQGMFLALGTLIAFLTVTLSLFVLRGRRGARTVTWFFSGGMGLFAAGITIVGARFVLGLERQVAVPDVLIPVQAAAVALTYGLVIILLATPGAAPYFLRPARLPHQFLPGR